MDYAGIRETELRMRYVRAFCILRSKGYFYSHSAPGLTKLIGSKRCVSIMMTMLLYDCNRKMPTGGPLGFITTDLPRHWGGVTALDFMTTGYEGLLVEVPAWRFPKPKSVPQLFQY